MSMNMAVWQQQLKLHENIRALVKKHFGGLKNVPPGLGVLGQEPPGPWRSMMRRKTVLILLLLAAAGLRCGADRAGMRDTVGFITAGADLGLSAAAGQSNNKGVKERMPARVMGQGSHEIAGIQQGRGGRSGSTGGDNISSNASTGKIETGAKTKGPDRKGGTDKKGSPAGKRGSSAAGIKESAPVKKKKDISYGEGNRNGMKTADADIATENKLSTDAKEKRKISSSGDKKSVLKKNEPVIIADKRRSGKDKKESAKKEDAGSTADAIHKNAERVDSGKAIKPSGYLEKPRVDEPAAH